MKSKIKQEMGLYTCNIVVDRPNAMLSPLVDIGVKFIIVGNGELTGDLPEGFIRVDRLTPDLHPDFILSQTKTENFTELANYANKIRKPLIHYETNHLPNVSKKKLGEYKYSSGYYNVFSQPDLVEVWEYLSGDEHVIEQGVDVNKIPLSKQRRIVVSSIIPVQAMAAGHIPIVVKNSYTSSIIKNGENGFLFSFYDDIKTYQAIINQMPEHEVYKIGNAARATVANHFTVENMVSKWRALLYKEYE